MCEGVDVWVGECVGVCGCECVGVGVGVGVSVCEWKMSDMKGSV